LTYPPYKLSEFCPTQHSVPLEAWGGPAGSRKLRLPDFMTTAKDGGKVTQHSMIGFYNRDDKCLLRGTNWVFK